jgi:hypothetical protein
VQYFPQVPGKLREVLMKAMGPFPEERWGSLRELRLALERFAWNVPDEPVPLTRPKRLKGLPPSPAELMFASVEDVLPTTVHKKLDPRLARTEEVPAIPFWTAKRRVLVEKAAWLSMGALLSLGLTLLVLPLRGKSAVAPAAVAAAPAPVIVAPAPQPAPPPSKIDPPALPPVTASPSKFDQQAIADDALEGVQKCFDDKGVWFGAGVLFSKEDAIARKVYLNPDEPLSLDERHCVRGALASLIAGAAPDRSTVVELRFRVKPDAAKSDVKIVPTK